MNIWMIRKNLMNQHYLKKSLLYLNIDDIIVADYVHAKIVCKDCEIPNFIIYMFKAINYS